MLQPPSIDISVSRYFSIAEMSDSYNIDQNKLFNILSLISKSYGRYANTDTYENYLVASASNETMGNEYNPNLITNWNMLVKYNHLYLNRVIPKTVFYNGPLNLETTYILCELLSINNTGLVTLDSQPGFFISEDLTFIGEKFLQLPYIQLLGPISELQLLIDDFRAFLDSKLIQGEIGYRYLALILQHTSYIADESKNMQVLKNLKVSNIGSLFLGVRPPESIDDESLNSFLFYILTNQFFIDVRNLILFSLGR